MESEQVDITRVPSVPGMSVKTMKLVERMQDGKPGDLLTDEQMESLIGVSTRPTGKGYGYLQSAIRYVLRNYAVRWQRVKREGVVKCLNASEVLDVVRTGTRQISRMAGRRIGDLKAVDPAKLDGRDKTEYLVSRAQLGLIRQSAGDHARKVLESKPDALADAAAIQRKALESMK